MEVPLVSPYPHVAVRSPYLYPCFAACSPYLYPQCCSLFSISIPPVLQPVLHLYTPQCCSRFSISIPPCCSLFSRPITPCFRPIPTHCCSLFSRPIPPCCSQWQCVFYRPILLVLHPMAMSVLQTHTPSVADCGSVCSADPYS